jgi:uncharacterized protein (TIGR03067 family)
METAREQPAVAVTPLALGDLEALQGCWEQVALQVDGLARPCDDLSPPGGTTVFIGNRFLVRAADGGQLLEGAFRLNVAANPKQVDWIDAEGPDAGKVLPAIYKLEGDRFVFVAGDADAPRPTQFCTGPGQVMRTFVRR